MSSGRGSLPAILRDLPEQLGLQGKDVIKHTIDASLEDFHRFVVLP